MDSEHRMRSKTDGAELTSKPRRGPGRQSPHQTRQRNLELLSNALDLFVKHGFEGTSIDGIAAAAGMAKRTVYLRYGNKTALFKAALQRAIEQWIVPVDRLRAAETADVDESLLNIAQILVENIVSPAGIRLMRITNAESGRMPEIGQFTYTRGTAPTVAYLTDFFHRRVRPDGREIRDPQQAAYAFLYLVVGGPASMLAWGLTMKGKDIDRHTRYSVHLLLHGLTHPDEGLGGRSATNRRSGKKDNRAASHGALPGTVQELQALREENRRLKLLLAESMLEAATLKGGKRRT